MARIDFTTKPQTLVRCTTNELLYVFSVRAFGFYVRWFAVVQHPSIDWWVADDPGGACV